MCYIHISALIAESLKRRGECPLLVINLHALPVALCMHGILFSSVLQGSKLK